MFRYATAITDLAVDLTDEGGGLQLSRHVVLVRVRRQGRWNRPGARAPPLRSVGPVQR